MSALCAAGIMYLLETSTGTCSVLESCVITEQYFDLMGRLILVGGIVVSLSLNESHELPGLISHQTLHGAVIN